MEPFVKALFRFLDVSVAILVAFPEGCVSPHPG